jgi:hypothetical protein
VASVSAVDVATMADADHSHEMIVFFYLVDDPVGAAPGQLGVVAPVWYNPLQRMSDPARTSRSTLAASGWLYYARFYAWRFS